MRRHENKNRALQSKLRLLQENVATLEHQVSHAQAGGAAERAREHMELARDARRSRGYASKV